MWNIPLITLVRLKETLIENTRLPGQIAVAAMAHSRRRTEEEWKQRWRERTEKDRGEWKSVDSGMKKASFRGTKQT